MKNFNERFVIIRIDVLGFTDPVNVKFANTPNAAKSMVGLPLAPSYLPGIPTAQQQTVLATVPPIRQQLNRYRYAALEKLRSPYWESSCLYYFFAI